MACPASSTVLALLIFLAVFAGSSATAHASPSRDLDSLRTLVDSGDLTGAEAIARRLLAASEVASPPDSLQMGLVLDQLAVILRRTGRERTREAEEICERALAIKTAMVGTEHESYAATLNTLGTLYFYRKEFARAKPLLTRALEIREARLGKDHPDVAWSLMTLGAIESETGSDSVASALVERAVAIQRARPDTREFDRVLGLNALATMRSRLGDYAGAVALYEEALALLKRGGNRAEAQVATCYHNLGVLQLDMYDLVSARASLERALRLRRRSLGKDHPMVAYTLMPIGGIRKEEGDVAGARACYEEAMELFIDAYGPRNSEVGWVKGKLGWIALDEGKSSEAARLLKESVEIQTAEIGPTHPALTIAVLGLAECAARSGGPAEAERHYVRAESLLVTAYGPRYPDLVHVLTRHAAFRLAERDSTGAVDLALRAAGIAREQLVLASGGFSERQVLAYASPSRDALDLALSIVSAGTRRGPESERVWDELIRSRALVLDQVARRNQYARLDSLGPEWERLRRSRQSLAALLVGGARSDSPERFHRSIEGARAGVEQAERDLARASTGFRSSMAVEHAGFDEVRRALPDGDALIAYAVHGKGSARSYLGFVLGSAGRVAVFPLGKAKDVDAHVRRWRDEAAHMPRTSARALEESACRAAGRALRSRVWDAFEPYVRHARRVFLVLDGSLHGVSFAALPSEAGGFLVESGPTIHVLSAERDLATEEVAVTGRGLLAVGGIDFDRGVDPGDRSPTSSHVVTASPPGDCPEFSSVSFPPLPDSEREAEAVVRIWKPSEEAVLLSGTRATERAFTRLSTGKRVLHLATHGFALTDPCVTGASPFPGARGIGGTVASGRVRGAPSTPESPLRLSGLVLAGANHRASAVRADQDGILTSEEIASLDLSGVEWAVLSSCETGGGGFVAREGVLGLSRAFRAAQVGTLIVSLWQVEDSFARTWMTYLYDERFRMGLATSDAVREATLHVLRDRRAQGRSTHPFHWAAFVATGSWN